MSEGMSLTLFVQTVKGETVTLSADPYDTIKTIKNKIYEQGHVPPQFQQLLFKGKELEDEATLVSYDIQNWASILLLPLTQPKAVKHDIPIKTLGGRTFNIQATLSDTVEEICSQIHKKEGIPLEQQQLIYGGKVMDWEKPLDHYGIQRGSALHVVCASSQRKVFLRLPTGGGQSVPMRILLKDPVNNLCKQISKKFEIPLDHQQIYFHGTLLEKHKTMDSYFIENGSIIDVQVKQPELKKPSSENPQMLYISTPIGKVVTIECSSSDTIREIKHKVHSSVGYDPNDQQLLLTGTPLDDDRTLKSYDIAMESTLHLILRPKVSDSIQIFVRTLMGRTITLETSLSDTIGSIKAKIQKSEGVACDQQRLLLGGESLHDGMKLGDYNVLTESTLQLALVHAPQAAGQPLRVKLTTGKILEFDDLTPSNTVHELKEKIFAEEKFPVDHQKLLLHGVELSDEMPLSGCGPQSQHVLELEIKDPSLPTLIFVRNLLGENVAIEVYPTDRVKTLKAKISEKEGVSSDQQVLLFRGESLDDERLLTDYNIEQESTLHLSLIAPKEELISIFVRTLIGKVLTIDISPSAKVQELKDKIYEMQGISQKLQKLFMNGVELKDELTLDTYNLQMQTTLQLTVQTQPTTPMPSLQSIFIKNPLGKTVTLSVSLGEKISEVKAKISKIEGIPPERQKLFLQGRELENDKILEDYGIERESSLVMVLQEEEDDDGRISAKMPFSSFGIVISKYHPSASTQVISVNSSITVGELYRHIGSSLNVSQNRLRLFLNGKMLTRAASNHLSNQEGSAIMLDVIDLVHDPLIGVFSGSHFEWKDRKINVKLPASTPIHTITIQVCKMSSKFHFPPSAQLCSQVYELSCILKQQGSHVATTTAAEVTVPFLTSGGRAPSFFQAVRVPNWQCDLTPMYTFRTVQGGTFNKQQCLATIELQQFDCFICVCS